MILAPLEYVETMDIRPHRSRMRYALRKIYAINIRPFQGREKQNNTISNIKELRF